MQKLFLSTLISFIIAFTPFVSSINVEIENLSTETIDISWIDDSNNAIKLEELPGNNRITMNSFEGHLFVFSVTANNEEVGRFVVTDYDEYLSMKYDEKSGWILSVGNVESQKTKTNKKLSSVSKKEEVIQSDGISTLMIRNNANVTIQIYWFDTTIDSYVSWGEPILNGFGQSIESFENHHFAARVYEAERVDEYEVSETVFKKAKYDEILLIVSEEGGVGEGGGSTGAMVSASGPGKKSKRLATQRVQEFSEFKSIVDSSLDQCASKASGSDGEAYEDCLASLLFPTVNGMEEQYKEVKYQRDLVSDRLRNYTCIDDSLETTPPVMTREEVVLGRNMTVDVLLNMDEAKIWVAHDFVTDEECGILMKSAVNKLQRATVSGEGGKAVESPSRKAQQAGYDAKDESDPLWNLYTRVFEMSNMYSGYGLSPEGQESFTIIQYNPTDEYVPHCDGDCDGKKHHSKGRVSTCVMYCKIPDAGGSTTFTNADIFVKPKKGMATFFSYKASDGMMDTGYTEHSGCPVIDGEKWITTVWMRDGVTAEEPSTHYDPTGAIKL